MATTKETTYIVQFDKQHVRPEDEYMKITVPSSWKVTFAPVSPGKGHYGGSDSLCMRFYEAENKQRALFRHVVSFRDTSIGIERGKLKTTAEQARGESMGTGLRLTDTSQYEWQKVH